MAGRLEAQLMDGAALSRKILEGCEVRAAAFTDARRDDVRAWRRCSSDMILRRSPTSK